MDRRALVHNRLKLEVFHIPTTNSCRKKKQTRREKKRKRGYKYAHYIKKDKLKRIYMQERERERGYICMYYHGMVSSWYT